MSSNRQKREDEADKNRRQPSIKVTKNGPYVVTGNVPLLKMRIEVDEYGDPCRWRETDRFPQREVYLLCRCGLSKNKPYCDNRHIDSGFDGTETASFEDFLKGTKTYEGPELTLTDKKELCVGAGFCGRAGNIWNLTVNSDNPDYKQTAIEEAADCPSGRLVLWDKQCSLIEPDFEPSIVITEDEEGYPGPIWVRGGISISSANGREYEVRNRVTLCNCGRSEKKPLCDGTHLDDGE
jgi:CDGSH-type Zn-finger protein